LSSIGQ
jgi:hypothetical protein